jgi:hypothetical protein
MQAIHHTVRRIADRVAILSKPSRELWFIALVSVLIFAISAWLDAFSWLIAWIHRHDTWQLDELFTTLLFCDRPCNLFFAQMERIAGADPATGKESGGEQTVDPDS